MDGDGVTLFACDYKVGRRGSVITPDLVRLALAEDGHLDRQCGKDNAGYERSNDLTIGRTFVSVAAARPSCRHSGIRSDIPTDA